MGFAGRIPSNSARLCGKAIHTGEANRTGHEGEGPSKATTKCLTKRLYIPAQNSFIGTAMRVIEVQVSRTDFAKTLVDMREWLDKNDRPLVRFQTEGKVDTITLKVHFEHANDLAERFPRAFRRAFPARFPRLLRGLNHRT